MGNGVHYVVFLCCLLVGCDYSDHPKIQPLSEPLLLGDGSAPRVNGKVGSTDQIAPAQVSYGRDMTPRLTPNVRSGQAGTIMLDFAETDIRDVVAQILGGVLHVNYTIDPAVTGAVTLHTATPLLPAEVLPTLQMLLGEVGASLGKTGGLYRVLPVGGKAGSGGGAGGSISMAEDAGLAGSSMVALHYAGAEDLAKALQPFVQAGSRVTPMAGTNALLVSGDPVTRDTIVSLVHAFDIDLLAGQSYALLPVPSGSAKDAATALQEALHGRGGALTQEVRVIPMTRVDAVLVVAASSHYIDDARRLFDLLERTRRTTMRNWHVYYLQNTNANDAAYVLQQAFTPDDVTAQPTQPPQPNIPGAGSQQMGQGTGGLTGGGGLGTGQAMTGGGLMGGAGGAASLLGQPAQAAGTGTGQAANQNPLLGGLDNSGGGNGGRQRGMRIIPSPQHNALLIYGTDQENDTVEDMLRRIDILPMQVRIDAVIAEVQLNDALRYGTQFFFKSGGINGVLSANSQTITTGRLATAAFSHTLPGFIIGGATGGGAPFAIDALQNVTKVHVLSSPQIMVLDNQPARLQVGQLVPIQTGSQSSTIGTSIYNQFTYQPTGVIMQVTPRVNNGGLVTLDISQEVSSVNDTSSSTVNPTFNDRSVTSRVVIQDGQTVGLAGLITDTSSRNNSGVPWFKDIPVLGFLAGNQSNNHQRTELLVLITPHVLHDQRDAQALTEDMRESLTSAAAVPDELARMHSSGSADPQARIRRGVGLGP